MPEALDDVKEVLRELDSDEELSTHPLVIPEKSKSWLWEACTGAMCCIIIALMFNFMKHDDDNPSPEPLPIVESVSTAPPLIESDFSDDTFDSLMFLSGGLEDMFVEEIITVTQKPKKVAKEKKNNEMKMSAANVYEPEGDFERIPRSCKWVDDMTYSILDLPDAPETKEESKQACRERCLSRPDCVGATYGVNKKHCQLSPYGAHLIPVDKDNGNGVWICNSGIKRKCDWKKRKRFDMIKEDYLVHHPVSVERSKEDCQNRCASTEGCQGSTYMKDGKCYLFGPAAELEDVPDGEDQDLVGSFVCDERKSGKAYIRNSNSEKESFLCYDSENSESPALTMRSDPQPDCIWEMIYKPTTFDFYPILIQNVVSKLYILPGSCGSKEKKDFRSVLSEWKKDCGLWIIHYVWGAGFDVRFHAGHETLSRAWDKGWSAIMEKSLQYCESEEHVSCLSPVWQIAMISGAIDRYYPNKFPIRPIQSVEKGLEEYGMSKLGAQLACDMWVKSRFNNEHKDMSIDTPEKFMEPRLKNPNMCKPICMKKSGCNFLQNGGRVDCIGYESCPYLGFIDTLYTSDSGEMNVFQKVGIKKIYEDRKCGKNERSKTPRSGTYKTCKADCLIDYRCNYFTFWESDSWCEFYETCESTEPEQDLVGTFELVGKVRHSDIANKGPACLKKGSERNCWNHDGLWKRLK